MAQPPNFSLRSLLAATAFVAVACWALLQPSLIWAIITPFIVSVLLSVATYRVMASPKKADRALWGSFSAGVAAFIVTAGFIEFLIASVGPPRFQQLLVVQGAFELIHGGARGPDFRSRLAYFSVSYYFILAVVVAAVAAFVARALLGQRDDG